MPIELQDYQKPFVYSGAARTVFIGGRGVGKSMVGGFAIANRATHGVSGLVIAPTYPMLMQAMVKSTLQILHGMGWSNHFVWNKTEKELFVYANGKKRPPTARAVFRSTVDPETIRGITDVQYLMGDEAALISPEALEIAQLCLRGEGIEHTQEFYMTTPRGSGNHISSMLDDPDTSVFRAHSMLNKYLPKDYEEKARKRLPDEFFRQEIYGEILDFTAQGVFRDTHVNILKDSSILHIPGEWVMGVDVGRTGDPSAVCIRHGNLIVHLETRHTPEQGHFLNWIRDLSQTYPLKRINIDSTGIGQFLPGVVRTMLPKVEVCPIGFGDGAKQDGYANRRAEIYFEFRRHIIDHKLHLAPHIDPALAKNLFQEMFATEYSIDGQDDFLLRKKEEIRKILQRSSDLADACSVACANTNSITTEMAASSFQKLQQSIKPAPRRRSK